MKTAAEIPVRTLQDGRLSIDPPPLTLADVAAAPRAAPATTLVRLWFSVQWWDEPAILGAYASAVRDRVDPRAILGAWGVRRGLVIASRPRRFETRRAGGPAIVTFARESRSAPPAAESATMVLERGEWRILHDTMLEEALAAYVQSRGSRGGEAPSAAAVRRGIEASRRFRDLAASRGVTRGR